jgi:probable rRNA maturation factor
MKNKKKSVVSLSSLPKRAFTDERTQIRLNWNKRALLDRIQFALSLCCERPVVLHVEFVDSLQIATLNWQFRGKDTPTDVLSFPPHVEHQYPHKGFEPENIGELAVCVEVCIKQAKTHKVTLSQEIEKMIFHGLIHLKGFDHERSDAAHAVMSSLERSVRSQVTRQLGFPDFCLPLTETEVKKKSASARGKK